MGRIVAIAGGDLNSTGPINKYIVDMAPKTNHNLLFIGTASYDNAGYIERMKMTFEPFGCQVEALCLVSKKYTNDEVDELLFWADIIYVGGGDTDYMMKVWKTYGLNQKLRDIYMKDTAVLSGISAGAICWFNCGHSDSEVFWTDGKVGYGWVNDMIGFHQYAFCPHYDERADVFDKMILEKDIPGLAIDSNAAFVEKNGQIIYIKSDESANAYIVKNNAGTIDKKQLEVEMVYQ